MPTAIPVTPTNMNYTVVYTSASLTPIHLPGAPPSCLPPIRSRCRQFFGILAFSFVYWHTHGKHTYTGPVVETDALYSPGGEGGVRADDERSGDSDGREKGKEREGSDAEAMA